jgi:hypothetical protein
LQLGVRNKRGNQRFQCGSSGRGRSELVSTSWSFIRRRRRLEKTSIWHFSQSAP